MKEIYVVEDFCSCRLCKGSQTRRSPLDFKASKALISGKYRARKIGARNPRLVVFPKELGGFTWSASGKPASSPVEEGYQESPVFAGTDSVHACDKIKENQQFTLHKKAKNCLSYKVTYTRR